MKNNLLLIVTVITFVFCIGVAFDISPYLRGPAPYPPDWRWDYLFVNTFYKIWVPSAVILVILFLVYKTEGFSEKNIERDEKKLLVLSVILFFIFQIAVLYFSRAGVGVLLHRIINADLNGYFTAAIQIKDISAFITDYNSTVLFLPQHAQGHPPGAILFFYALEQMIRTFSSILSFVQSLDVAHSDVAIVWKGLSISQKATALFSGFLIPFLSSVTLLPLYFLAKMLYSVRAAIRCVFLYISVPSVILFIPINDVFLPIFTMFSFLCFVVGIKEEKNYLLVLAGLLFSLGLFFSISLLPLFFIFLVYIFFQRIPFKKRVIKGVVFSMGLFIFPLLLYFFYGYNTIEVSKTLMSGLPEQRAYLTWVFYNLYDFFIFAGIPLLILFVLLCVSTIMNVTKNSRNKQIDAVTLGFIGMMFILNFSGSVRGEVARIWLPFYPFLVLILAYYLTHQLKSKTKFFMIILFLQLMQILVMQEFWVMLW